MGQDKAQIFFHGKPLWQHQLELLRGLQPAEILISAKADPLWRPPDVRLVLDEPPSRGPLSGVAAAINGIRTEYLLALAIDMPLMDEPQLRFLCAQIALGCGVLPMIGDRAEPLSAIYPVNANADLAGALAGSDFSLQSLTKTLMKSGKLRPLPIQQGEEHFYRNFNQMADFASP